MSISTIQFPSLLFGSCWIFITIAQDITHDVAAFNFTATIISNKNRAELEERFRGMVHIYSETKQ